MVVKKGVKTIVDTALTGIALGQIGNTFTGNLAGIGRATQAVVATGLLARTSKDILKPSKGNINFFK